MAPPQTYSSLFSIIITISLCTTSSAFDPMPLQDICVADLDNPFPTSANGLYPCKDYTTVTVNDFIKRGLHIPVNTNNPPYNAAFIGVSAFNLPGLNSMGLSLAQADLGKGGYFPLHYHRKATEMNIVLKGCLEMGFISPESSNYTLYRKKLRKGDVFVVPMGLIHYQANCGSRRTSLYAILNSQNPGINSITHAAFGATPAIDSGYLGRVFKLDRKIVEGLQAKDWTENI